MAGFKFQPCWFIKNPGQYMLEAAKEGQPISFKTLRQMKNPRTGRPYSTTTITKRLKELVQAGALKETPSTSPQGRKVVGYQITAEGLKALEISYEYEEKLRGILK